MLKTTINITITSHNLKQRDKLLKSAIRDFLIEPLSDGKSHHILLTKDSDARVKLDLEHFHTGRVETEFEKAKRKAAKKPLSQLNDKV